MAGLYLGAVMEGSQPHGRPEPVRHAHRARRHARRRDHRHELRRHQDDPEALHEGVQRRAARPQREGRRARRLRRVRAPRRPAGPRRGHQRRSRTRTPRRACSSSSTAPTPTSSPTSSSPRTTRCASATPRPCSRSTRPAATPRRWASSAPSSASIHVLGNLDKPETLGPSISAAFIATLLGVATANVIYLPISARLQAALAGGAALPLADRRGHPLDPGRRQPARRPGEAHHLRPAVPAPRRGRSRQRPAAAAEKAAA